MSEYNGWKNYETWRINLEVFDGFDATDILNSYDFADGDFDKAVSDLSSTLDSIVDEMITEETRGRGFAYDLAQSFIARVDFEEIAEHMVNDYIADVCRDIS